MYKPLIAPHPAPKQYINFSFKLDTLTFDTLNAHNRLIAHDTIKTIIKFFCVKKIVFKATSII